MKLSDFDYHLPKELIAQKPISPRDSSRLLVVDRKTKEIKHKKFRDIFDYLFPGDALVLNDSKVVPARLLGEKSFFSSAKKAEILLLKPKGKEIFDFSFWPKTWLAIGGPNLKEKEEIYFKENFFAKIEKKSGYELEISFNLGGEELKKEIISLSRTPLPPYIKTIPKGAKEKYQTVYAKHFGSIAAPTAGFHFTSELLEKIKNKGVKIQYLTLHIGLGTFLPVKTNEIEKYKIHREYFVLDKKTADALNEVKNQGKKIVAVGTTTSRVLEFCAGKDGLVYPKEGWTDLFIYPGYKFKFIDALITNFHLPKSTLLMLVCAFGGKELIFKCYEEAVKNKYRFYSFGDAMAII